MASIEPYRILLTPRFSEKSAMLADKFRQVTFVVWPQANKDQIKQAVEMCFDVKVAAVHICRYQGKRRVFRQIPGKHKQWKKAYVTLKAGYDIKFVP